MLSQCRHFLPKQSQTSVLSCPVFYLYQLLPIYLRHYNCTQCKYNSSTAKKQKQKETSSDTQLSLEIKIWFKIMHDIIFQLFFFLECCAFICRLNFLQGLLSLHPILSFPYVTWNVAENVTFVKVQRNKAGIFHKSNYFQDFLKFPNTCTLGMQHFKVRKAKHTKS